MERRTCVVLVLVLWSVDPGFGQRGDVDVGQWFRDQVELMKKEVEGCRDDVRAPRTKLSAAPQTAFFSASLADVGEIYRGPCSHKILIFRRIFSNAGGGYDPNTGIFTAAASGVYFFSFSTYGYNTHVMGAILMKNGVRQVSAYDDPSADGSDSSSNAVVLPLAAGDQVFMELWDTTPSPASSSFLFKSV